MPKPEPFDGKNTATVGRWLYTMEHFFTVLRIPEDWDRIQLAVS
jgi:hypothetical protein